MAVIAQYDPKQETLDNTIKLVDGYYMADNGRVKSEFYKVGNEVVFINKGRRISWKPESMKYLDEFGNEDIIYSVQDVPLEVKANYARYNRSMPDVDDWFIQENDRLKHQIIVQGFQRDPMPWLFGNIEFIIGGKLSFDSDLKVVANGREQTGDFEADGAIHLYDGDTLVFTLPEIVAFDSALDRSMIFGKYRVTKNIAGSFSFDIVLPNEWVSSLDRVYPIVIDPTVIVSSGYDTSGNGGRKFVRLSNGWLFALLRNSTNAYYIYRSTDNGSTWTQIYSGTSGGYGDGCIVTDGNRIYLIISLGSGTAIAYRTIEADGTSNFSGYIDQSQTVIGNCSLAYNPSDNTLHAAWASRNSTYPNSYNIRYAKGTINPNGSVTWGSVEQVSKCKGNLGGNGVSNPTIIVLNNNPIIFADYDVPNDSGIVTFNKLLSSDELYTRYSTGFDTGGWNSKIIDIDNPYARQKTSVCVDKNGTIHVAWHGSDRDEQFDNIRYSRSINGGSVWSAPTKLASPNTTYRKNASITCDRNNKLYITYEENGVIKRIESTDGGATWSAPYTVDTGTNPSMLFDPTFAGFLVAWIYMSGSSVKFEKILLNQPPNAPNLTARSNFDATQSAVFSWTYDDPDPSNNQSAYQLQIIDAATGTIVYDTGKVASISSSHTLPAGTLTNNKQYQWRVKTWDSLDTEGPYSTLSTFYTSAKPTVTITSPANGTTLTSSSLTVQWSFSDPESEGQSAYQVRLLDANNNVLEDTGKINGVTARSRTLTTTLSNNTTYKIEVTVWDAKDVPSVAVTNTFTTSFTPPATPTLSATQGEGCIILSINNPAPTGSQPNITGNDIYKKIDGVWKRIATNIPSSGVYRDYAVASGVIYEYKVQAIGNNGTISESTIVSQSITLTGVWLHDVQDPQGTVHQFKYDGNGRNENWQPTVAMMQFAGRRLPIAEYDDSETRSINVKLQLLKGTDDREKLEALIKSKNTLCYRDGRGRKMFCHAFQLPIEDEFYGNAVSLTFEEVSYTEEV